jgi:hypothetical protein
MILTATDIFYLQERDGDSTTTDRPATPVAFVINGEVVAAEAFSPPIGDNIFLANPAYTARMEEINGEQVEVITATVGDTSTDMILDELLTSVLLSEPTAIRITRDKSLQVAAGWKHDEKGFYIMQTVGGVERRIDGMGNVVVGTDE